jgi:hypothetical protein
MYEIAEPGEIGDFLVLLLDLIAIEAAWSEILVQTQAVLDLVREVKHGRQARARFGWSWEEA